MDPLTNLQVISVILVLRSVINLYLFKSMFQVAVKNDVGVFYFAVVVPLNIYFEENGQMDKREFLQLWKEIPEQNELQFSLNNTLNLSAGFFFMFLFLADLFLLIQ